LQTYREGDVVMTRNTGWSEFDRTDKILHKEFSFPANFRSVRNALRSITRSVSVDWPDGADVLDFELVLAEILNNIVEHAYAGNCEGMIQVSVFRSDNRFWCQVVDDGVKFLTGLLSDCAMPDPATLPEGGWGWNLVHSITSSVAYTRDGNTNRVTFSMPF
jgi:serine/threonine-protein kinase RsbW